MRIGRLDRGLHPSALPLCYFISSGFGLGIFSIKLVSKSPRRKSACRMILAWQGIVVLIPVIKYSLRERAILEIAEPRVDPMQINLAIIES